MSAYIVDKKTIDRVVTGFLKTPEAKFFNKSPNQIGKILWDENVKSVNCRYSENTKSTRYKYEEAEETLRQYYSSARCLNYQSCEHEKYEKSIAYQIIEAVCRYCRLELNDIIYKNLVVKTDDCEWG